MTVDELQRLRTSLRATQFQMAEAMGMPLRTYLDIEGGKKPIRPIHKVAAMGAGFTLFINGAGTVDLPPQHRTLIDAANKMLASVDAGKMPQNE